MVGALAAGAAILTAVGAIDRWAAGSASAAVEVTTLGRSVEGRPIRAFRMGDPNAPRKALVVGAIHGDERAGLRITEALLAGQFDLTGVDLWVVPKLNPDGIADHERRNARGVDLNRNFPYRWKGGVPRSSGYYPGRRALSEPETRIATRLIEQLQPAVAIWYHQPWGGVLACGGDPVERRYSELSGLATKCRGEGLHGTAINWENHRVPAGRAFVVELGKGKLAADAAARHAGAAAEVARTGAGAASVPEAPRAAPGTPGAAAPPPGVAAGKPPIKKKRIPYGPERRNDMAEYSKRHYGEYIWQLTAPKQIVQHFSVTSTAQQVYDTFAPNKPDPELNELPGVCSHYVINPKGVIWELVPVTIRCRHVIGLNHVSIGIEHVGHSDAEVMRRKPQLNASLRLTRWLRCRFGIPVTDVIGHAESLGSPYYQELVPEARGRTHSDFKPRTMRRYRGKLNALGGC